MRRLISLTCIVLTTFVSLFAQDIESEKEAIKSTIQNAYIDGIQNNGDIKNIENGFHEGFNLLGVRDNMLTKFPIYSWIQSVENRKEKNPNPPTEDKKITCNYVFIDVTGNAAMAKIELYRNSEILFTDYLQLYKFEEGWKIVSKIYFRH